MASDKKHRALWTAAAALFWLFCWTVAALAVNQELLLPTPWLVAATLWRLLQTADFWRAAAASLARIVAGFAAGVAAGVGLALLTSQMEAARHLCEPLLKVIRATPVASFIILALVWLRTNTLPAFIAFLMVLPIIWGNVEKGVRQTDRNLLEMAKVFRFGRTKTLWHIRLPSVMPYLVSGCATALGLAWKSGIAAEVICRPDDSIGRLLQTAKNHLETAEVFAYTVAVILLSVALEKLLFLLVRRMKNASREEVVT